MRESGLRVKRQDMVIPPPVRPPRITNFLKPYVLKMHFTNKYVSAQVIHTPTATVASSASSQEKALRSSMETSRDVAAAAKIGKLLAERLFLKGIPAVSVHLKREQKYHGKIKAHNGMFHAMPGVFSNFHSLNPNGVGINIIFHSHIGVTAAVAILGSHWGHSSSLSSKTAQE
ncbi:rplR, partial [Mucuna pruriens]